MMRTTLKFGLVYLLLTACVTINVYFPAAAAQEAADQIIQEVQGDNTGGGSEPQSSLPPQTDGPLLAFAGAVLDVLIPPAHAQSQANLDVSTPAVRTLIASMKSRNPRLAPYIKSGAVGYTNTGTIALRDLKLVPLPDRSKVNKLVADENNDRNALYREIARANGHPEWEADIRKTFAQRWVSNASAGSYYQNSAGQWVRK